MRNHPEDFCLPIWSTPTSVVLVIYGGKANLEFVRLVVEESRADRLLVLDEILLMNALRQERFLLMNRAAQVIQKSESEARAVLHRLVEAGLLEGRGDRRSKTYYFSSATYRRLGLEPEHEVKRGSDPAQREQMILQFIDKHGRITRKEAVELCMLSSAQAWYILTRMVQEGQLERHGEKRGVFYVRASKSMD